MGARNPSHQEPVYWDRAALREETTRVLDICHGCRRCAQLCPSFTGLFRRIDEIEDAQTAAAGGKSAAAVLAEASTEIKEEGHHAPSPDIGSGTAGEEHGLPAAAIDPSLLLTQSPVEALSDADHQKVVDECYHCNLCFNLCPYHPPHRFELDFPKLMRRHKAVALRERGAKLSDKLFARVDLVGTVSSWFAPIVNFMNGWRPNRLLLSAVLGIHPDRRLPKFHFQTFLRWWSMRARRRDPVMPAQAGTQDSRAPAYAGATKKVALFYTCSVNYNEPRIGRAAVAILEKNGFEIVCPPQRCCGMPHLDIGDLESAKAAARENVGWLAPLAREGMPIVALGPTCSYMLKRDYPELLGTDDAKLVAAHTFDATEFLVKLKAEGRLSTDFKSGPGKVAYQPACHLKNQNIGLKSKELLELLPGSSVAVVDRCTGHDGTWSMKNEYFELSMKYAKKLFDELEQTGADALSTDCPLAGLQIAQGTGRAPAHPLELVAEAYGIDPDKT